MTETNWTFKDKVVLITGGTGTVGIALTERLLAMGPDERPKRIRILSRDETKQFEMFHRFSQYNTMVRYLVGDVRDKERLDRAFEEVECIFHLAAMKHVHACEYNPFEGIKTNIVGSQNVIEMAIKHNVKRVAFTSSDKAANPCNAMGASKLMAERLFTAANYYKGKTDVKFYSVRLGNVVGSRGSILPLIVEQIRSNRPITLTDVEMTRFIITMEEVVDFLLHSMRVADGGEILVPKMKAVKTPDLIEAIINCYCRKFGADPVKTKQRIQVIGARPGEKNYEDLITEEESLRSYEDRRLYKVISVLAPESEELLTRKDHFKFSGMDKVKPGPVASRNPDGGFLTVSQIEGVIERFVQ